MNENKNASFFEQHKKHFFACLCLGLLSIQTLGAKWNQTQEAHISKKAPSSTTIASVSAFSAGERITDLGTSSNKKAPKKELNVLINDPNMSEKWGLKLTDSKAAWNLTKGSKDIVVAVIDTGIDVKHEDLKENLWVNKGETGKDSKGRDKSKNGIDDDKNGYIDDVHGWSFTSNDSNLTDNHGHGTHISGILGAVGGNGKGISGVSPNVSIMSLKYYDPKSPGNNNLAFTIKSIHYAVENGAHIINYSGGGLEFSKEEKAAIERAQKKGILFVAAAGNEKSNSDKSKYYPADYELDNIISVTAIDTNKKVLPSSNYGVVTVDIAAPGKDIYSTWPKGRYRHMTGTSQATAFVSGVGALLMAHNSDFDAKQVAKYIKNTGDVVDSLKGKTRYNRKLNSYRALSILDTNVGATGVVADNLSNFPKESFSSDKFKYQEKASKSSITGFSTALLDKINKNKRALNSDREPNSKKINPLKNEAEKMPLQQK